MTAALLLRLVNVVLLVLASVWFARANWDWEPAIAVLGLAATMVAQEFRAERLTEAEAQRVREANERLAKRVRHDDRDGALFERLLQTLPSSGSIRFIRDFNMAGFSFHADELLDLSRFLNEWDDAEHEFIDPEVDAARRLLYSRIQSYLSLVSVETFPLDAGTISVPQEWEHEQPDRFERVVAALHNEAEAIVEAHKAAVQLGIRKFGTSVTQPP